MYKKIQNAVVTGVASAMVAIGAIAVAPDSAEAACAGSNARNQITVDTAEVRMDSCVANDLVNGYGDAKDASALAALVGAKYPAVSFLAAPFYAWAWANQSTVRNCAANNTGIVFTEVNGIIMSCSAQ